MANVIITAALGKIDSVVTGFHEGAAVFRNSERPVIKTPPLVVNTDEAGRTIVVLNPIRAVFPTYSKTAVAGALCPSWNAGVSIASFTRPLQSSGGIDANITAIPVAVRTTLTTLEGQTEAGVIVGDTAVANEFSFPALTECGVGAGFSWRNLFNSSARPPIHPASWTEAGGISRASLAD